MNHFHPDCLRPQVGSDVWLTSVLGVYNNFPDQLLQVLDHILCPAIQVMGIHGTEADGLPVFWYAVDEFCLHKNAIVSMVMPN